MVAKYYSLIYILKFYKTKNYITCFGLTRIVLVLFETDVTEVSGLEDETFLKNSDFFKSLKAAKEKKLS